MNNCFPMSIKIFESNKFLKMPLSAQVLYVDLCRVADIEAGEDGWFYKNVNSLITNTKLSRCSIIKGKKLLFKNKFIDIKRGYFVHSKKRSDDFFKLINR